MAFQGGEQANEIVSPSFSQWTQSMTQAPTLTMYLVRYEPVDYVVVTGKVFLIL